MDPSRTRLIGYASALAAGTLWATTGPLSTALYAEGAEVTGVGFWRIAIAVVALTPYALIRAKDFRIDGRGLLAVGLGGGALVALFEVAYQFAIAGTGVAGAAALLYTAPVIVAILAVPLLDEGLTVLRLTLAVMVAVGAFLTVQGGQGGGVGLPGLGAGVVGGLLAALAYAGTTLIARWAVPRYGVAPVLFYEILGGTLILGLVLVATGQTPAVPQSGGAWVYVLSLSLGTIILANLFFFQALRRIEAAPAAVAATIEPVFAALLALTFFGQGLSVFGWMGLVLVVLGVAGGYVEEAVRE